MSQLWLVGSSILQALSTVWIVGEELMSLNYKPNLVLSRIRCVPVIPPLWNGSVCRPRFSESINCKLYFLVWFPAAAQSSAYSSYIHASQTVEVVRPYQISEGV